MQSPFLGNKKSLAKYNLTDELIQAMINVNTETKLKMKKEKKLKVWSIQWVLEFKGETYK